MVVSKDGNVLKKAPGDECLTQIRWSARADGRGHSHCGGGSGDPLICQNTKDGDGMSMVWSVLEWIRMR